MAHWWIDPTADTEATQWAADRAGWGWINLPFAVVAQRRDLAITGVITYTDWTEASCMVHVVSDGTRRWATPAFLRFAFRYPFQQLKVERLTSIVAASNRSALHLAYKLGFMPEATLSRYFPHGDSGVVLRMLRNDCRWLES